MICAELGRERSAIMQMRLPRDSGIKSTCSALLPKCSFFLVITGRTEFREALRSMVRKQVEGERERYAVSTSVPSLEEQDRGDELTEYHDIWLSEGI